MPVWRESGKLNESLRDQIRRTGTQIDPSTPPDGMKSKYSATGNTVVFEIPSESVKRLRAVPVLAAFIIGLFFFLRWAMSDMPSDARWVFTGFLILVPTLVSILLIASAIRKTIVTANASVLEIKTVVLFRTSTITIPAAELEDLRIEEKDIDHREPTASEQESAELEDEFYRCIVAVSDRQWAYFGDELSRKELEWIRAVIVKAISGA